MPSLKKQFTHDEHFDECERAEAPLQQKDKVDVFSGASQYSKDFLMFVAQHDKYAMRSKRYYELSLDEAKSLGGIIY